MLRALPSGTFGLAVALVSVVIGGTAAAARGQAFPVRVKQLSTEAERQSATSQPAEFTQVGSLVFFVAHDTVNGRELWKTDGTAEGTALVRDIWPGNSTSSGPQNLIEFNGVLLFSASDGVRGMELWRSDGTVAGTYMLGDYCPGETGSNPHTFIHMGDFVSFFSSCGRGDLNGPWRTDGTVAGTYRISPGAPCCLPDGTCQILVPGACAAINGWPQLPTTTCVGTNCLQPVPFVCCLNDGRCVFLLQSDCAVQNGTLLPAGSTCLPRTCPIPVPPAACCMPSHECVLLTAELCIEGGGSPRGAHAACSPADLCTCAPVPCQPAFVRCCRPDGSCILARDTASCASAGGVASNSVACEAAAQPCIERMVGCCRNDGACHVMTLAGCLNAGGIPRKFGTGVCTITCPVPATTDVIIGACVAKVGSKYMVIRQAGEVPTRGLYTWDGTPNGYVLVREFAPVPGYSGVVRYFAVLGDELLFVLDDGIAGLEWWASDGTPAGTRMVKDIRPGAGHSYEEMVSQIAPLVSGGFVYFFANDGTHGPQLWRTDGTESGTTRLTTLVDLYSVQGPIVPVPGSVVFRAYPAATGSAWFRLDPGSPTGAEAITSRNFAGTREVAWNDERAFFMPSDTASEIWTTDGTVAGTNVLVPTSVSGGHAIKSLRWLPGLGRLMFSLREPWISDGTPAGTRQLYDIAAGVWSRTLKPLGGEGLIFLAPDSATGLEPYISDGTPGGTHLLKDIVPGLGSSSPHSFTPVETSSGRVVYFVAQMPGYNSVLWKTDGTAAGTNSVGDPNGVRSAGPHPAHHAMHGGLMYFAGGVHNQALELYRTDGTAEGTVLVYERPGETGVFDRGSREFCSRGSYLYFIGWDGLFRTDGTAAGTILLKAEADNIALRNLTGFGDYVYFTRYGQFWRTDGTVGGTVPVDGINPAPNGVHSVTAIGDQLFFTAQNAPGGHGYELWSTNGTPNASIRRTDINPGVADSHPAHVTAFDGEVIFIAATATGSDLMKLDGSPAGASRALTAVQMPSPVVALYVWNGKLLLGTSNATWIMDSLTASPQFLASTVLTRPLPAGDRLYFGESRPFVTDGTPSGTRPAMSGIEFGSNDWRVDERIVVGSSLYFVAWSERGFELFRSSGDGALATMVMEFLPGAGSAGLTPMSSIGDKLLFAGTRLRGSGLYALDTAASVPMNPTWIGLTQGALFPLDAGNLTPGDGVLYFTEWSSSCCQNRKLFATDGTDAGTRLVTNFDHTPLSRTALGVNPQLQLADAFIFVGNRSYTGWELYKTTSGDNYEMIVELNPSGGSGAPFLPNAMTRVGTRAFYSADNPTTGQELAVTDGTAAGTRYVKDILPGTRGSDISGITDLQGVAIFIAENGTNGFELWRSDGTAAGTYLVKDILPGPASPGISGITAVGEFVYFTANDGIHGRELWRSDGTEGGTTLVRDAWLGPLGSNPTWLTATGDHLHFVAYTPETGPELWISDGTAAGTFMLFQMAFGPSGSNIEQLTVSGDKLYFLATALPDGTSLWSYDWPGTLLAACRADYDRTGALTVGDLFAFLADWFAHASRADVNGDGAVGIQDIFDYLTSYFQGCS